MINSILWTDFYKLSMQNIVRKLYPNVCVHYKMIMRKHLKFPDGFYKLLMDRVGEMSNIRMSTAEYLHLKYSYPFLPNDYVDWLREYRFNPKEVIISQEGSELFVDVYGPWESTILWEVPLLAIIADLYYKTTGAKLDEDYIVRAIEKSKFIKDNHLNVVEGGSRRAASPEIHERLYGIYHKYGIETSNVRLAMSHGSAARGTYAHEFVMAHAAIMGVRLANRIAMVVWDDEYDVMKHPEISTALVDTYTTDFFFRETPKKVINRFNAFRIDSGDPFVIGEKVLNHLVKLRLDIRSKKLVFSDSLTVQKAYELNKHFSESLRQANYIPTAFIMGNHLTNDVGYDPVDIVLKPFAFHIPSENMYTEVAKISDTKGKYSGSDEAIHHALLEIGETV